MALHLGSAAISSLRLGTATPAKVMLGTTQVWPPAVEPPPGGDLWTPAAIETAAWLDCSDLSTIRVNANDRVVGVDDKSGNDRHATQVNAGMQPRTGFVQQNGLNTITFGPQHHLLSLPTFFGETTFSENFTLFVAGIVTGGVGGSNLWALLSSSGSVAGQAALIFVRGQTDVNTFPFFLVPGHPAAAEAVTDRVFNRATIMQFKRRSVADPLRYSCAASGHVLLTASFNNPSLNQTVVAQWDLFHDISNNRSAFGSMFEVIMLAGDANVTVANEQRVEGYLAHKWGTADELPVDHPYKNAPPPMPRPWTPADDPAVEAWWDASDLSTVDVLDGKVTNWRSKSGPTRVASQSTVTMQPALDQINGLTTFRYSARSAGAVPQLRMDGPFTGSFGSVDTIGTFIAHSPSFSNSYNLLSSAPQTSGNAAWDWFIHDPEGARLWGLFGNNRGIAPGGPALAAHMIIGATRQTSGSYWDSLNPSVRWNLGGNRSPGHAFIFGAFWPGGPALNGTIHETIILYDSVVDPRVYEGYLAHKWGLQERLAANHPYKNAPPVT